MSLVYTAPAAGNTASSGGGNSRRNSVYIGGKKEAKSLEMLQQRGISRILNVTPAKETSIQVRVSNTQGSIIKYTYWVVYPSFLLTVLCFVTDCTTRTHNRRVSPIILKSPANSCTGAFRSTMLPLARQHSKKSLRKSYRLYPVDCSMEVSWCIVGMGCLDRPRA